MSISDIIRNIATLNRSIGNAITGTSKELQGTAVDATFRGPLSDEVDALTVQFDAISSDVKKNIAEVRSIFKVYGLETIQYQPAMSLMPNRRYLFEGTLMTVISLPQGQEGDVIAFIGNVVDGNSANITILAEDLNREIQGVAFSCHVYFYEGKWRFVANNFDSIVRRSTGSNAKGHYRIGPNMIQMFMRAVPGTTAEWPIAWPDDFRIVKTLVSTQSAKSVTRAGYRLDQARGQYEAVIRPVQQITTGRAGRVDFLSNDGVTLAWISKSQSDIGVPPGTSFAFVNTSGEIGDWKQGSSTVFSSIVDCKQTFVSERMGYAFTTSDPGLSNLPNIKRVDYTADGGSPTVNITSANLTGTPLTNKHSTLFSFNHEGRAFVVLTCTSGNVAGSSNEETILMEMTYDNNDGEVLTQVARFPVRFDGTVSFRSDGDKAYLVGYDAFGNRINALTIKTDGTYHHHFVDLGLAEPTASGACYHLPLDDNDFYVLNAIETGVSSNHFAYRSLYDTNGHLALARVDIDAGANTIEELLGTMGIANGVPYVYENVTYIAYSLALLNQFIVVRPQWTGTELSFIPEYNFYLKDTGLLTKYSVNDREYVVSVSLSSFANERDIASIFELGTRRAEVDVMVTGVRDAFLHNPTATIN